jgi:methylthioribose-1-phosphate isomerase
MSHVPRTLEWIGDTDGFLRLLDQTRLPGEVVFRDCRTAEDVHEAIRALRVRGAPAIGIAAAYGLILGVRSLPESRPFSDRIKEIAAYLRTSRPTAGNLTWALAAMARCRSLDELLRTARHIEADDESKCRNIGRHGAGLVPDGGGVLTHCNSGSLAASAHGTALGVLCAAAAEGKRFHVFVDETRPLLQGSRLTAWELGRQGIDATLICDNMAGQVMREGRVQLIIVGADRIAANGDTANKIGTYSLAVLARAHGIPFFVAAPTSTFDLTIPDGESIPIEQRDRREVTHGFGTATAPDGVNVYNPAFDVTPAELITGIVCELGVIRPISAATIRACLADANSQI